MANDVVGVRANQTGLTAYMLVWDRDGNVWDGVDTQFESYLTAQLDNYDIPASGEQGTASRRYNFTFPSGIAAGFYSVELFEQVGGSPSETNDRLIGEGSVEWDGSAIIPRNDIPANLLDLSNAIETNWTLRQVVRVALAALAGKSSGHENDAPVYRDITDAKDRITATTDSNNNRTAVTLDGS